MFSLYHFTVKIGFNHTPQGGVIKRLPDYESGAHAQHMRRVVVVARIPIAVDIREVGGVGDGTKPEACSIANIFWCKIKEWEPIVSGAYIINSSECFCTVYFWFAHQSRLNRVPTPVICR